MNMSINKPSNPLRAKHPYRAMMEGFPGVVAVYLLDLSREGFPYVDVYAGDNRRLNIQPDQLLGKPYNWEGISAGVREPRARAIEHLIESGKETAIYEYQYWDRETLWEFDCQLCLLPANYLLLVVADAHDWQASYWTSSALGLELLKQNSILP